MNNTKFLKAPGMRTIPNKTGSIRRT